jgi:hypothetical protein
VSFGQPFALLLLILVATIAILMRRGDRLVRTRLERIVASRLLPSLTDAIDEGRRRQRRFLFLAGLTCLRLRSHDGERFRRLKIFEDAISFSP